MTTVRFGAMALLASTALISGCASDSTAPSALAAGNATNASATTPAGVDNFMLVDANLQAHELYRMADAPAIVIVIQANGDAATRAQASTLNEIAAAYAPKGVELMMMNSSLKDGREAILAEAQKAGYRLPILMDGYQLVGESLGVTRSGEAYVINPKTWTVAYRGPVAGLSAALDAVLAGKPPPAATAASAGGLIDFPARAHPQKISYAKDVAPILEKNCVGCHQEGGIGPFAMSNYAMVKGFSPMIREVIRTDRMPPWNIDSHVGKWADDKSLSRQEIQTIVHWVDHGAPRGEGEDPLKVARHVAEKWPLGKPDLILDIPAYTIPASGVVDYQHPAIANPLKEGRWIKASTFVVDQRQAVHHFLTGYMTEMPKDGQGTEDKWGASVGGYAVSSESTLWPINVGTYLPPGGAIGIQAHYTPFGKEVTDHSKLGLYFYKDGEKPDLVMRTSVIVDNSIVIPPGQARHEEVSYLQVPKDMLLYSAFPHAHYRGYASDLWIQYPDGKKKLLLAMPRYDFNWQREYTFAEPLKVPAGSKLIAHYWYDNSKQNPANPDPKKEIRWGLQSWDEMFYTAIRYRWLDETSTKLVEYDKLMDQSRLLGMWDDNMDGKIEQAEFKGDFGDKLRPFFAQMDQDKSGGVENAELMAALKVMGERRHREQAQQTPPAAPPAGPGGGR
jgi:mono/diheme cytochrome c family protein/Ca2+-binding EF-hand superfamily protein